MLEAGQGRKLHPNLYYGSCGWATISSTCAADKMSPFQVSHSWFPNISDKHAPLIKDTFLKLQSQPFKKKIKLPSRKYSDVSHTTLPLFQLGSARWPSKSFFLSSVSMISRISACICVSSSCRFCRISGDSPGRPVALIRRSLVLVSFRFLTTSTSGRSHEKRKGS